MRANVLLLLFFPSVVISEYFETVCHSNILLKNTYIHIQTLPLQAVSPGTNALRRRWPTSVRCTPGRMRSDDHSRLLWHSPSHSISYSQSPSHSSSHSHLFGRWCAHTLALCHTPLHLHKLSASPAQPYPRTHSQPPPPPPLRREHLPSHT